VFDPAEFVEEAVEGLKKQISSKAVVACSGGVDSSVCAVLASMAIGDRALSIFVDHGLVRKGERDLVEKMLGKFHANFKVVDAREEFLGALEGVSEPEQKRKLIGARFIEVFEREAKPFGAEFLVQGTIAPDWIESGGGLRDTIKSHHNVGGLPERMALKLAEPLRDLYKDEVRKVARHLGLENAERQPFPGPGLAVRILGEISEEKLEIVRESCSIVEEEIEKAAAAGKCELPWQYFAALLNVRSVGVQGDTRSYGWTVVVRAVGAKDAMTAHWSRIPDEVLERISTRITNTMGKKVNRVVYDISNKPPGTIEWE
jgi:GMP synthase (glutamine-hydrolysing)